MKKSDKIKIYDCTIVEGMTMTFEFFDTTPFLPPSEDTIMLNFVIIIHFIFLIVLVVMFVTLHKILFGFPCL
jgi:hypothetical protein